jgi:hypothetical protein
MNIRFWILFGYSLLFFFGGHWIFQATSLPQFALVLLGYIALVTACLWWWTTHAAIEDLDPESGRATPVTADTKEVVSQSKSRTTRTLAPLTWPTES